MDESNVFRKAQRAVLVAELMAATWIAAGLVCAAEPRPHAADEQILLMGPVKLGELYTNMHNKEVFGDWIAKGSGLTNAQIIEALNGCKLYVVDSRRPTTGADGWEFSENGRPKVLLEGELSFDLKNAKGKPFHLHVGKVVFADVNTAGTARTGSLHVELKTDQFLRENKLGGLVQIWQTDLNFRSNYLAWDVKGKLRPLDKGKKKE
jgi:hypothetical protein